MKTNLEKLADVTDIAKAPGNGDANEYMRGMANGLILALAIMQDTEVDYLPAPQHNTSSAIGCASDTNPAERETWARQRAMEMAISVLTANGVPGASIAEGSLTRLAQEIVGFTGTGVFTISGETASAAD